ncbi:MAG: dephospho-CoA kinase [Anaerolineales bacterium]|jgi:dephospho-CoA kinase|nr:dephospho-CoA kinase [Anaerolineales bacterium]
MSAWQGKYVIGLTGNIATGKSVVRKMLEHLGAYGIDADALSHRAIAKDAPGYQPIVNLFGRWILGPDGQIDRARLGRVVFSDPEALLHLEAIVHPLVRQAVNILARRAQQKVIVIEAIKLLESPLRATLDSLWVTYSPPPVQLARLMQKRNMPEEAARQRILVQSPQEEKLALANVVIRNEGSFEDTWKQVVAAWQATVPALTVETTPQPAAPQGKMLVEKVRPRQSAEIASLITRLSQGARTLKSEDIMAAFGEKAFLAVTIDGALKGIIGWQVENLVARCDDIYLDPALPAEEALRLLTEEVERASRDLQCEASLIFVPAHFAGQEQTWHALGYEPRTIESLGVRAWQEAAQETQSAGEIMLFKQLRKDRVLRPV